MRLPFYISGRIAVDDYGNINRIILNNRDPFAFQFKKAIQTFLNEITVNLGEIQVLTKRRLFLQKTVLGNNMLQFKKRLF